MMSQGQETKERRKNIKERKNKGIKMKEKKQLKNLVIRKV